MAATVLLGACAAGDGLGDRTAAVSSASPPASGSASGSEPADGLDLAPMASPDPPTLKDVDFEVTDWALAAAGPKARSPLHRAKAIVASWPLEAVVGRLFMPSFNGTTAASPTPAEAAGNRALAGVDSVTEMIRRYHVGGVILFAASSPDGDPTQQPGRNIVNPTQLARLTGDLQKVAADVHPGVPLMVGTDQENGVVTRIRLPATPLPGAMALGAAGSPVLTRDAARVSGVELRSLGVNLTFAPVADVLTDSRNWVVGSRAFGSDPAQVADQVRAAVYGYRDAGVAVSVKHFPGHGSVTADSHVTLPVVGSSVAELERSALPPFRAAVAAGAGTVMVGHLDVRAVDPGVPASTSRRVVTGLLRKRLGYDGVIVTDSMQMAPVLVPSPEEAVVRAVAAGVDLILMPARLDRAVRAVLGAVKSGRIPQAQVRRSAERVVALSLEQQAAPPAENPKILGEQEHRDTAVRAAAGAVTELAGPCTKPLVPSGSPVSLAGGSAALRVRFASALWDAGVRVVPAGGTVVRLYGRGGSDPGGGQVPADVDVAFDVPFRLAGGSAPTRLAAFSDVPASLRAVAEVIAGRASAQGRSPVPVGGLPSSACRG